MMKQFVRWVAPPLILTATTLNDLLTSCNAGDCSICPSGEPITAPDRKLNLEYPFFIETCGKLDSFMGFVSDTSEDCVGIRTLGGLCGCPVKEGTCRLCPSSSSPLRDPTATLTNENTEVVQLAPDGLALTCEFVDSYLQSFFSEEEDSCNATRSIYLPECECGGRGSGNPDSSGNTSRGTTTTTVGLLLFCISYLCVYFDWLG